MNRTANSAANQLPGSGIPDASARAPLADRSKSAASIPSHQIALAMNDDAMIAAYADDDAIELLRQRIREDAASDLHWPSIVLGVLVFGVGIVWTFLP